MANANVIKFKLIFTQGKKKDGTTFTKMMTILKNADGSDFWCGVRFGESVNDKLFKGENQIITAMKEDVRLPRVNKPYMGKDGKMKYPYVWCDKIVGYDKYIYKGTSEPVETTQSAFSMDDESTEPISGNIGIPSEE